MSRSRASQLTSVVLHGAACLVLTVASTGASCGVDPGGGTTGDFDDDGATDTDDVTATDSLATTGDTTTATTTPTTTPPGTESDPTEPDTDASGSDDGTSTGGEGACMHSGIYTARMLERLDALGHFPYLKLFYDPNAPEQTTDELLEVQVEDDGTITISVLPRVPGTGEGHTGLADMQGTIDEECGFEIVAQPSFESDTGPFGTVDATLEGTFTLYQPAPAPAPTLSLTLEGGGIPNGPITFEIEIAGEQ